LTGERRLRSLRIVSEPELKLLNFLLAGFSFYLGCSIGSFLNVCIYRLPRDLSVDKPKRSFCPECKYQIPWHANIPLVTWLIQRGKCANCGCKIAFRYFAVELLTGLLFLAVWLHIGLSHWIIGFGLWTFISLLIVATFIDIEHYIIPDGITIGGAVAGLIFSVITPLLHGTNSHLEGLMWGAIGAATGFGMLWFVSNAGKMAFGKKRMKFDPASEFEWISKDDTAELKIGGKTHEWMDLFSNEKDVLVLDCTAIEVAGARHENIVIRSVYERLTVADQEYNLNELKSFSGTAKSLSFTREAMGFGDVKFMACIGAFLGWKATIATMLIASVVGAIVGVATIAIGRRDWSSKIPFGPYLALGAVIWVFYGTELLALWHTYTMPPLE